MAAPCRSTRPRPRRHGDYPHNERGRHQYPRRYFFEQISGVMAESNRSVPCFIDKHLAYRSVSPPITDTDSLTPIHHGRPESDSM